MLSARIVGIKSVEFDEEKGQIWLRLVLANGNEGVTYWDVADMECFAGEVEMHGLPVDATVQ